MKEDFLQYIWRTKNFALTSLCTTSREPLQILDFGTLNREGGPDFLDCKIQIDGTLWAGNVEIHVTSSEWYRHGHQDDPSYESVVLHVVLEEDEIVHVGERRLQCLELKGRIDGGLLKRYYKLMQFEDPISCSRHIGNIDAVLLRSWLERMTIERLESKVEFFDAIRRDGDRSWDEVLYISLARSFGFRSNGDQLQRLATAIPLNTVRALSDRAALEALFFGTAGMLNRVFHDPEAVGMQKEYYHLSRKYEIPAMDARTWQWGRLRPANFPTIRIAQFCSFLAREPYFLTSIESAHSLAGLRAGLAAEASEYWIYRSDFDRPSRPRQRHLGRGSVDLVIINTVLPFLFIYGKYRDSPDLCDRALRMLMEIAPENNRITRSWQSLGVPNDSAADSQGLIHLRREFCDRRRCAECAVGAAILNQTALVHGR